MKGREVMRRALDIVYLLFICSACSLYAGASSAQTYPTRPIRIIVPNSPGSVPDIIARSIGPDMGDLLGQPVIVENKTGATQIIGTEYVAKQAPADGYTICLLTVSTMVVLPLIVKDLRFDPVRDLPPFIGLADGRLVFGSSAKLPWKTFNEMVAYAKANPGKLNYGASGPLIRLLAESVIGELGLNVVHVPYSAAAPYYQGLVSGEVQMGFVGDSDVMNFGEKFRPLAVTGKQRRAPLTDVPTFQELGFPQVLGVSYALGAAAATPKAIITKLHAAASGALDKQDVRARFAKIQLEASGGTTEAIANTFAEQARLFADIARKVGIQPQ